MVLATIVAGGLLTYAFEQDKSGSNITSITDALWWAVVTATTVGYGDLFPSSPEGRVVAVILMLVGIGLLSVVTANIAAFFVGSDENEDLNEVKERLARIEVLLEQQVDRSARVGHRHQSVTDTENSSSPGLT